MQRLFFWQPRYDFIHSVQNDLIEQSDSELLVL